MTSAKPDLSKSKYRFVFRSKNRDLSEEKQAEESNDYAEFLRSMERRRGHSGFVDSKFYKKKLEQSDSQSKKESSNLPPAPMGKSPRVLSVVNSRSEQEEDYRKVVKSIEEGMWKAKQEERHLKRSEGDIINSQRDVKKSLREYEQKVEKRRFEQDINMTQSTIMHDDLQRQFSHRKHEESRNRTVEAFSSDHYDRTHGRKTQLNGMQLDRQYHAKIDELNLRNLEKTRLAKEYETKMRMKEDEEMRIKRELEEIVSAMNMESMKQKRYTVDTQRERKKKQKEKINTDLESERDLEENIEKSGRFAKDGEAAKKRIEAERNSELQSKAVKIREDERALQTTRIQLGGVANRQMQLNSLARDTKKEVENRKIDSRLEAAASRRSHLAQMKKQERQEIVAQSQEYYAEKAHKKLLETKRRVHEDNLKHFHRSVLLGEDMEHGLYSRVKSAEMNRQLQEQRVRHLEEEMISAKKDETLAYNQLLTEASEREKSLTQQLSRAKAELTKAHTQRESGYVRLLHYRNLIADDKSRYQEYLGQHQRLLKIGARSDSHTDDGGSGHVVTA